jgi:hypothetical protein
MNDPERDKFYSGPPPEGDDEEYELDEPDPDVDEFRKRVILESLERRIDIDEVYREAERDRSSEILEGWVRGFRNFRWQFGVKHLLILTAVVSIGLALGKLGVFLPVLLVAVMLSVASLYFYLNLQDSKHQAEAERKREALYAERRKQFGPAAPSHVVGGPVEEPLPANDDSQLLDQTDEIGQESAERESFRFRYSLRDLILVMTAAAVVLGTMHWLGGPAVTATMLGFVALAGLVAFAVGYDPPQIIAFGWWFTLVLYVIVSLIAAIWGGLA